MIKLPVKDKRLTITSNINEIDLEVFIHRFAKMATGVVCKDFDIEIVASIKPTSPSVDKHYN